MKLSWILIVLCSITSMWTAPASAQPLPIGQSQSLTLEIATQDAYPNSLATMVRVSTVIVKGRFGRLLSHGPFWGYGETRESMERRVGSRPELIDKLALPLSEYEIEIEEVLMGKVEGDTLVLHVLETNPGDKRFTDETVERLFFLVRNSDDTTYVRPGPPYILSNRNGSYSYEYVAGTFLGVLSRPLEFLPAMTADEFEALLKEEIALQPHKSL